MRVTPARNKPARTTASESRENRTSRSKSSKSRRIRKRGSNWTKRKRGAVKKSVKKDINNNIPRSSADTSSATSRRRNTDATNTINTRSNSYGSSSTYPVSVSTRSSRSTQSRGLNARQVFYYIDSAPQSILRSSANRRRSPSTTRRVHFALDVQSSETTPRPAVNFAPTPPSTRDSSPSTNNRESSSSHAARSSSPDSSRLATDNRRRSTSRSDTRSSAVTSSTNANSDRGRSRSRSANESSSISSSFAPPSTLISSANRRRSPSTTRRVTFATNVDSSETVPSSTVNFASSPPSTRHSSSTNTNIDESNSDSPRSLRGNSRSRNPSGSPSRDSSDGRGNSSSRHSSSPANNREGSSSRVLRSSSRDSSRSAANNMGRSTSRADTTSSTPTPSTTPENDLKKCKRGGVFHKKNPMDFGDGLRVASDPAPCNSETYPCANVNARVECPLKSPCGNFKIAAQQYADIEVYKVNDVIGNGLRTNVDLKRGDFVIEYTGKLVDEAAFNQTVALHKQHKKKTVFGYHLGGGYFIDSEEYGNIARFVNHRCEPNMVVERWDVRGTKRREGVRTLIFRAGCDIKAGESLYINYNTAYNKNNIHRCTCAGANCTGFLGRGPSGDVTLIGAQELDDIDEVPWRNENIPRPTDEEVEQAIDVLRAELSDDRSDDRKLQNFVTNQLKKETDKKKQRLLLEVLKSIRKDGRQLPMRVSTAGSSSQSH